MSAGGLVTTDVAGSTVAKWRRDGGTNGFLELSFPSTKSTFNTSHSFIFKTGGSEKMRLEVDGALLLGTADDGVATAGDMVVAGGIFLGGNAAANELDDYEEGTFTPTYAPTTTIIFR